MLDFTLIISHSYICLWDKSPKLGLTLKKRLIDLDYK